MQNCEKCYHLAVCKSTTLAFGKWQPIGFCGHFAPIVPIEKPENEDVEIHAASIVTVVSIARRVFAEEIKKVGVIRNCGLTNPKAKLVYPNEK